MDQDSQRAGDKGQDQSTKTFVVFFVNGQHVEVEAEQVSDVHGVFRLTNSQGVVAALFTASQITGIVDKAMIHEDANSAASS